MHPRLYPPRALVLMLAVIPLLLGPFVAGGGNSLANQSGPGMSDRLGNLNALCQLNGGTPGTYTSIDTIVTRFSCKGGALDGLYCDVYDDLTYCYWERVGHAAAGGGGTVREVTVQVRDLTFVTDLASDPVVPFGGVVPTAPITAEAVVSRNTSDAAANQARQVQINGCRHLGGTERIAGKVAVVSEPVTIGCIEGLLDGMWCTMRARSNACFVDRSDQDAPRTTPTLAPGRPATATAPATSVPASTTVPPSPTATRGATVMPTATSTVETTEVPATFVDPTAEGPWAPPQGTFPPLEPAPTPTDVPILL